MSDHNVEDYLVTAVAFLRKLEWNTEVNHDVYGCDSCKGADPSYHYTDEPKGHKPDCKLDAFLTKMKSLGL